LVIGPTRVQSSMADWSSKRLRAHTKQAGNQAFHLSSETAVQRSEGHLLATPKQRKSRLLPLANRKLKQNVPSTLKATNQSMRLSPSSIRIGSGVSQHDLQPGLL